MGEKRVSLKDRVYVTAVWRNVVKTLAHEKYISLVGRLKAADDSECCRFSATRRAEKRNKFAVVNIEIEFLENRFTVKALGYIAELYDFRITVHYVYPLFKYFFARPKAKARPTRPYNPESCQASKKARKRAVFSVH